MDKEEMLKEYQEKLFEARQVDILLNSLGWKTYQNIKNKKIQALKENAFKSEMTLKKFEYNRGYIRALEEMEAEMKSISLESEEAINGINKLTAKPG